MAGNGGIIGPTNTVTNGCAACGAASGVWQMNTVYNFVKTNDWVYNFAEADYLVVGGGASGGYDGGGGGGAGGYRTSYGNPCAAAITQKWGTFAITVGAGGAMATANPAPGTPGGKAGTDSIFDLKEDAFEVRE